MTIIQLYQWSISRPSLVLYVSTCFSLHLNNDDSVIIITICNVRVKNMFLYTHKANSQQGTIIPYIIFSIDLLLAHVNLITIGIRQENAFMSCTYFLLARLAS